MLRRLRVHHFLTIRTNFWPHHVNGSLNDEAKLSISLLSEFRYDIYRKLLQLLIRHERT